jgi:hypothetical protein
MHQVLNQYFSFRAKRRPFQIFSELGRDALPVAEMGRYCGSNLYEGPVSNECECNLPISQWTTNDEVIVAIY